MKQRNVLQLWIRNATIYLFTIFKNKSTYYNREGSKGREHVVQIFVQFVNNLCVMIKLYANALNDIL